jgi:hypothetical protein
LVAEVLVALITNTPRHNERAVIRLRLGSLQSAAVAVRDSAQNQPLHTSVRTVVPVAAVSETLLREEVQQQGKDLPGALLAQARARMMWVVVVVVVLVRWVKQQPATVVMVAQGQVRQ